MKSFTWQHPGRRLFFKIALVFSIALITIITLQIITMHAIFEPHRFPAMMRGAVDHAKRLVEEIGEPPNLQTAARIHRELGIQFRIEGLGVNWVSNPQMIAFADVELESTTGQPGIRADFTPHGFCIDIHRGAVHALLLVHPKGENIRNVGQTFLLILILYTTVVIIIMFFIVKWLLRDVRVLAEGMQQIGEGNLKHRMSTRRRDELGQLIHSFNTMSDKIQEMINSRERLLLDVSHELRSPLTRIKLALEFLEDTDIKSAISGDVLEVEAMVAELLEGERLISPHGGLKRSPCKLAELVSEIVFEFRDRQPPISLSFIPASLNIELDRERFKIMLRNILDNAIRYSDADSPAVELEINHGPKELTISIHDHGHGIPAQDLPYIFEPFYRVDKSRSKETGGYGLGMNLVYKIVQAHGGRIEIESQLGSGTTVRAHLPC